MGSGLSQLLDPARISLNVQNTRRTAALNEVAKLLESHPSVSNFSGFYSELLARERLDTTCLGNSIALPHARTEHVKEIVLAVGRSPNGILFEDAGQTVKLVFILGTPKSNPADYLKVVSALCKVLKEAPDRQALFEASSPMAFIEAVKAIEAKIPSLARV
jgi:mannitol/fructose-specific phosphotransferase system IIA component (Ntr-type)